MSIARVGIVGAGTMGSGIAANLAVHGKDVLLFDASRDQVEKAMTSVGAFLARAVERGRMAEAEAAVARGRVVPVASLAELRYGHLVIEAVFEDFDLKAGLFAELSPVLEIDTLVATNTSCLRVGDLARSMSHPERFLGLHYFSPAAVNPIVEVVRGDATGEGAVAAAAAFCRETGKLPILCRDSYGFAINRFFCPYTNEAARLVDEGVAGPAAIDALAREALGAAAGPFAVMNLIGPRTNLHAIRNLAPLGPFYAAARAMAEVGESGRPWDIPAEPAPPDAAARAEIVDRLRLGAFLPVLQALDEGVAPAADLDRGAREALKFASPPCALMDRLGAAEVERVVAPALARYGVPRPASLGTVGGLLAP